MVRYSGKARTLRKIRTVLSGLKNRIVTDSGYKDTELIDYDKVKLNLDPVKRNSYKYIQFIIKNREFSNMQNQFVGIFDRINESDNLNNSTGQLNSNPESKKHKDKVQ